MELARLPSWHDCCLVARLANMGVVRSNRDVDFVLADQLLSSGNKPSRERSVEASSMGQDSIGCRQQPKPRLLPSLVFDGMEKSLVIYIDISTHSICLHPHRHTPESVCPHWHSFRFGLVLRGQESTPTILLESSPPCHLSDAESILGWVMSPAKFSYECPSDHTD